MLQILKTTLIHFKGKKGNTMPANRTFWIFPNANLINATYNSQPQRTTALQNIGNLFSTQILAIGGKNSSVHPAIYYSDDRDHHALNAAWGGMETNIEHLLRSGTPCQGRATSIRITGLTVYHETAPYNRRNFDGICTLFYTFDAQTRNITIHAIGAHQNNDYYLDCASQAFDAAVQALRNAQWGYRDNGILRFR